MDIEPQVVQGRAGSTPALVDRLDPVLGEASSGIGMMLTELIRRTLRGGIQRVDDELHGLVNEKVDGAVALRMPNIESAAEETALRTATAVATREVQALDQRTSEVTTQLARDLVETSERLQSHAGQMVSDLERRAGERLVHELSYAEQRAAEKISEEVASLETRTKEHVAHDLEALETRTKASTEELVTREIDGVEQRSETKARSLLEEEVALLREKSRTATQALSKHVNALHEAHSELRHELAVEQQSRSESLSRMDASVQAIQAELIERWTSELGRSAASWKRMWEESDAARQALEERVAELERPRGLKAFAAKLFSRKKTDEIPHVVDQVLEEIGEPEDATGTTR